MTFRTPTHDAHKRIADGWHLTLPEAERAGCRRGVLFDQPAIEVPYFDLDGKPIGHSRWRMSDPAAAGRKYHNPSGAGVHLFISRSLAKRLKAVARNPKRVLYITEGEAKSIVAGKNGYRCLAVSGAQSWQAGGKPAPEFDWFEWEGRKVVIVLDSDFRQNSEVRRWFAKLGAFLEERGARVEFVPLPLLKENRTSDNPLKDKTGLDDFLHFEGKEAFKKLARVGMDVASKWLEAQDTDGMPEILRRLEPMDPMWLTEKPPEPEWLLKPYLQQGEIAAVVGRGSVGKSFWVLYGALAIATGGNPLGFELQLDRSDDSTPITRRVMYVMLERHAKSFRRRVDTVVRDIRKTLPKPDRGAFNKRIVRNFYPVPLAGESLQLIEFKNGQWLPCYRRIYELVEIITQHGIRVVCFDPLSRLHGADENSSSVAAAMTKALEAVVAATECSIVLISHTGKSDRGDQYAMRGSSAWVDNTSQLITLEALTGDERANSRFVDRNDKPVIVPPAVDVIRVEHRRCSDGARALPTFVSRNPNAGSLHPLNVFSQEAEQLLRSVTKSDSCTLCEWAANRLKGFTRSGFAKDRLKIFGKGVSEVSAESAFDKAVKDGLFIRSGKVTSGSSYVVNPKFDLSSASWAPNSTQLTQLDANPSAT